MIYPTARNIRYGAFVGVPAMSLCSFDGSLATVGVVVMGIFTFVLCVDAYLLYRIPPVLDWVFPKKLEGNVGSGVICSVRVTSAVDLEMAIEPERNDACQEMTGIIQKRIMKGVGVDFIWVFHWIKRGVHEIKNWHYVYFSPLKFWRRKKIYQNRLEISLYPELKREQKSLASFLVNRIREGERLHQQRGQGSEFDRLREYVQGDSLGDIHWKATARHSKVISKTYRMERNQEVYVILDHSRLSLRESSNVPNFNQLDHAIDAALCLGRVAGESGDRWGVMAMSDRIQFFIRSGRGRAHDRRCRDLLFRLESKRVAPDFEEMIVFLRRQIRKRSLLLFLTALDDPLQADLFQEQIEILARQHVVHVVMPVEKKVRPLFERDREMDQGTTRYERLTGHILYQQMKELRMTLLHRGVHLTLCEDAHFSRSLIEKYLKIKRSQIV